MIFYKIRAALLVLICAALVPCLAAQQGNAEDIAVIVHPSNAVKGLSLRALRSLFRGEQRVWEGREPVLLLMRAFGAPEREVALRLGLQMSESDYSQYWAEKTFTGEAAAKPVVTFSNGTQLDSVAHIPGAIAFVAARDVRGGVKVVRIDNLLPGEKGYPLKHNR
jgi:ABC-type phosphate transport system substrate-binding protein